MGLFHTDHNPEIPAQFDAIINAGTTETESQFLDSLNEIVKMVEVEDSYGTNAKLKIYELLSQLANCSPSERSKYAGKIRKLLK
jgi:hypothetical protein